MRAASPYGWAGPRKSPLAGLFRGDRSPPARLMLTAAGQWIQASPARGPTAQVCLRARGGNVSTSIPPLGHCSAMPCRALDRLPRYCQSQILARAGFDLHCALFADWLGKAAFHLEPVVDRLAAHLKQSGKLSPTATHKTASMTSCRRTSTRQDKPPVRAC